MFKIIITLLLLILGFSNKTHSQSVLNVHLNNAPIFSLLVSNVDSIQYSNIVPQTITIYGNNPTADYAFLISNVDSITFSSPNLPSVSTLIATNIGETTAQSGGDVIDDGGSIIMARGVCWSTSPNPTVDLSTKTVDGATTGLFSSYLSLLTQNQLYYVRAYATNIVGTAYGEEFTFSTLQTPVLATITTTLITAITYDAAEGGGTISSDGGSGVTLRGICWSTSINPTTSLSTKTIDGLGTGSFSSSMTGLLPNQLYHVRAYATNSVGTVYGEDISFTTTNLPLLPIITTDPVTNITYNGATMGGVITNAGASQVTSRGICWSTSPSPTSDLITANFLGSGTGSFSCNLLNYLAANTTYYVRAFAINSAGTAYGNEVVFVSAAPILPTLGTSTYSYFTTTSFQASCSITNDGGSPILEKGVCWSTSPNPTVNEITKTLNGPGLNSFVNSITNLTPGTLYYYRSYATNSVGTAYGTQNQTTIPLPANPPALNFSDLNYGTVVDIDGNAYSTIQIGTQIWMAQNLRVTRYSNGDSIPNIQGSLEWADATTDAFSYYNNDTSTAEVYGNYYNYKVASDSRNVCPVGWRVPSNGNWATLVSYSGGSQNAADSLKEPGSVHWTTANCLTCNNPKGFTAVGAGYRSETTGSFDSFKFKTYWWTRTSFGSGTGYAYSTRANVSTISSTALSIDNPAGRGCSIRCIKDTVPPMTAISTVSSITSTSAVTNGNLVYQGYPVCTNYGVCWNTSPNPTPNDFRTNNTFNPTNLAPATTYYIKSFAISLNDTIYSNNELVFTTANALDVPTISTSVSLPSQTTVFASSTITWDGGSPITDKGFCWSTSPNPDINLPTKTSNGIGSANFSTTLTGLLPSTTYYVRAYATNTTGTGYGPEKTITTTP